MKRLIDGLRQFVQTVQVEEQELFSRLEESQEPDVLFVTCSDSRIAPHWMTQTRPGDLFVIRNAGNIIPPHDRHVGGEAATVEYATTALEVSDIIICGHSNCGAMKGLLNLDKLRTMPYVQEWLRYCEPVRGIAHEQLGDLDDEARLDRTIELNVLEQLSHLGGHPSVAARLESGDLNLHGWVYDIGSGDVRAFDSETGVFASLHDASHTVAGIKDVESLAETPSPTRGIKLGGTGLAVMTWELMETFDAVGGELLGTLL